MRYFIKQNYRSVQEIGLHLLTFLHKQWESIKTLISSLGSRMCISAAYLSSVQFKLFPQFRECWRNWNSEWVNLSSFIVQIHNYFWFIWVTVRRLKVSFDWVTYRLLLEPWNVSDGSVKFEELVQLVYQKEPVQKNDLFMNRTSLRTVCRRLWITGNNVVNNVEFLPQTDCFAS